MLRLIFPRVLAVLAIASVSTFAVVADHHEKGEHDHEHGDHSHAAADLPDFGVAVLRPTKGNKVRGQLRLMAKDDVIKVVGRVSNLTPGKHGFHIHQFGDARSNDGKAAGGHYNPDGHDHGAPGTVSHVGDLGNITAGENGVAEVDVTIKGHPLHFLFGRSFVVHAGEDDLKSQPSGAAGDRVAVGIIGIGNKEFKMARGKKKD